MKAIDLSKAVKHVTKKYTAQRKRERRTSRARLYRREYMSSSRVNQTDVAWEAIPKAYAKVSDNGRLPAHARQIFYAARKEIQDRSGRPLQSVYFTQTLLPKYINLHGVEHWWVVYDARGHLIEPHTEESVPLGTIEVDNYLSDIDQYEAGPVESWKALKTDFPTKGTANRISAILFIEKEGFNELFKATKLAERYDIAIMSTKGQSVVAARKLVDALCYDGGGVPVLVLHDFDKSGLEICQNLTSVSDAARCADRVRYEFAHDINVIDLGLRLADVEAWGLGSESVRFKGNFGPDSIATPAERDFLRGNQRVELNAFTSADFIKWIESKLEEHGIKKLVPDEGTLEQAYRRAVQVHLINQQVKSALDSADKKAQEAKVPESLRAEIESRITEDPEMPWDKALANFVAEAAEE